MTFGHPVVTGVFIWLLCSPFNREIAETGVVAIAGTLLRIPFSDKKYFSKLIKEQGFVIIEYMTELSKRKHVELTISEIKDFSQSRNRYLIDLPSELIATLPDRTLIFSVLDKKREVLI